MAQLLQKSAIIVGDLTDTNGERGIIIKTQSDGLQRISDLHPSFMALQYPYCFLLEKMVSTLAFLISIMKEEEK